MTRRPSSWLATATAASALALTTAGFAQVGTINTPEGPLPPGHGSEHPAPLPFLDARYDDDLPAQFVLDALDAGRSGDALERRELERRALAAEIVDLRLDDDELFGTPHFLRSTAVFLTQPLAEGTWTPTMVVADFVDEYPALFEIASSEIVAARLSRYFSTRHNGVTHMTFQQQIDGVDLFGCEVKTNVTRDGELINISSTMLPRPERGFGVTPVGLRPIDAIRAAAKNVGIEMTVEPVVEKSEGDKLFWSRTKDFRTDQSVTTEPIFFPLTRGDIRSAYAVQIPEIGLGNTYEMIIDATTGDVLRRWNQLHFLGGSQNTSFRVYTSDSPAPGTPGTSSPNGTQFSTVPREFVTITGASVSAASPNGWIDDGDNQTLGNNCDAHTDLNGDNSADLPRPSGSPFRVFDFGLNLNNQPSSYSDASVANAFYHVNVYHDALYLMGFDEPAKNFQQTNFGNGGASTDRVQMDVQDGAAVNNASFGTSGADGSIGRCSMFNWSGPSPDRDGSLDSEVIYHELSHGLSIRLFNGQVGGEQSGGMGEGWGDFFALSLNAEPGDDPNANYPFGGYVTFLHGGGFQTNNYYYGIRRFPYTTNLSDNPLTFRDIDPNQYGTGGSPVNPLIAINPDEVHQAGEVWAVALWECRANLINSMGFAGNQEMMQLVVDGMKLAPNNPNMLQARDGVLQADAINNGGVNAPALWLGFAKRGMGSSATSPGNGSSTTGVQEAFDLANFAQFNYPAGRPTQLTPNQMTSFPVIVSGINGGVLLPGTGTLTYRVDGGAFITVPMPESTPNNYTVTLPAADCFETVEYYLSVDLTVATVSDPSNAPNVTHTAQVFEGIAVALTDNFQSNQGWTVSSSASDGQWEIATPQNNDRGDPPTDFDGSGQCLLTDADNSTTNSDVDNGSTTVTSPVFDLSNGGSISYAYWLNDTSAGSLSSADAFDVEVATNAAGTNWTLLRQYTSASAAWRTDTIAIGAEIAASPTIRIRFRVNDDDPQNIVEAGIDAVQVDQYECVGVGFAFCFGDGLGPICPCGNNSNPGFDAGCVNSSGDGCLLLATGEGSIQNDTLHFTIIAAVPDSFAVLVSGDNQLNNGLGLQAFDGLRCVGGNLFRHGTRGIDDFGSTPNGWGPPNGPAGGLIAQGGFGTGQTRNFQVFFRESDTAICQTGQNTSNGFSVTFTP